MHLRPQLIAALLLVLLLAGVGLAQENKVQTVNAAKYVDPKAADAGLQRAIDAVPPGGVLVIPAGKYVLRRTLMLKSDMTLSGVGPETVLTVAPELPCSDLADNAPLPPPMPDPARPAPATAESGPARIRVKDPRGFAPGMQITVRDKKNNAWKESFAVIASIAGDVLTLDRELKDQYGQHAMRFRVADGAQTGNLFPAVMAYRQKNVTIQFLRIVGPEKQPPFNRFVLDAIHLVDCENVLVTRCEVDRWHSDGFSVQGGRNALVMDNVARRCAGHGFHPGTGLQDSFWSGNLGEGNGAFGLYYCWNNKHVIVSHNRFVRNGSYGIGRLGDGGDVDNLVCDNVCEFNGAAGIHCGMWGDCRGNFVVGNLVRNNCQKAPGAGILLQKSRENIIARNRIVDDQPKPTQIAGVEELKDGADGNWIAANEVTGARQDVILAGNKTTVDADFPGRIPPERLKLLDDLLKRDADNWARWQERRKTIVAPKP